MADARSQIQALDGQLRSARELAQHATPEGFQAYARIEAHTPWTLRLQSAMARLRANFTLRSTAFRHALRLAAAVALGDIAGHWLASWMGWQRAYWLPMTVAIVLRPDFTGTVARGVLRVAGTLVGLALATALFHLLAPSPPAQVVLLVLLAFCLRYFGPANYGLFAMALTALVVVLVSLTGVEPGPVIAARGWNTIAGGLIALAAYRLWPTWEYTQFGESLARLLDAYRAYFQLVRDAYLAPAESFASRLDPARLAARLARSELEASVARIRSEPGTSAERLRRIDMILANSHRFIQAAMALEAGLASSRPVPARPAFRVFANDVDFTLYHLAAALRASPRSGPTARPSRAPSFPPVHDRPRRRAARAGKCRNRPRHKQPQYFRGRDPFRARSEPVLNLAKNSRQLARTGPGTLEYRGMSYGFSRLIADHCGYYRGHGRHPGRAAVGSAGKHGRGNPPCDQQMGRGNPVA